MINALKTFHFVVYHHIDIKKIQYPQIFSFFNLD